jgi:hypothetical protein
VIAAFGQLAPADLYQLVTTGRADKQHFDFNQVYNQGAAFMYEVSKPVGKISAGEQLLSWYRSQSCRDYLEDTDSVSFLETFTPRAPPTC